MFGGYGSNSYNLSDYAPLDPTAMLAAFGAPVQLQQQNQQSTSSAPLQPGSGPGDASTSAQPVYRSQSTTVPTAQTVQREDAPPQTRQVQHPQQQERRNPPNAAELRRQREEQMTMQQQQQQQRQRHQKEQEQRQMREMQRQQNIRQMQLTQHQLQMQFMLQNRQAGVAPSSEAHRTQTEKEIVANMVEYPTMQNGIPRYHVRIEGRVHQAEGVLHYFRSNQIPVHDRLRQELPENHPMHVRNDRPVARPLNPQQPPSGPGAAPGPGHGMPVPQGVNFQFTPPQHHGQQQQQQMMHRMQAPPQNQNQTSSFMRTPQQLLQLHMQHQQQFAQQQQLALQQQQMMRPPYMPPPAQQSVPRSAQMPPPYSKTPPRFDGTHQTMARNAMPAAQVNSSISSDQAPPPSSFSPPARD
uniref:Uncharacterized protein n=1 Tax=Caenorhabditis japonica TaxID=281687 RepID=A0A8R1EL61_CAEJA